MEPLDNPPAAAGPDTLIIARRFRGPPGAGNGGYVAGSLAQHCAGPVEVTLRRPAPLDRPLAIVAEGEAIELRDGAAVVATARAVPVDLAVPPPPDLATIEALEEDRDFGTGEYALCFGCGRERHPPDGLCVRPRWIESERRMVAAPWTPHRDQVDAGGRVPHALVWAALDCPGGLAALGSEAPAALTGRIHAEVLATPQAGEPCRILGWRAGVEGRKRFAGTALFDGRGTLIARALSTWILVR